jgi:hypothetical protein
VSQEPAKAIRRSNVGFQPNRRSGRQQLKQGLPRLVPVWPLLRLGTVDADETDSPAIAAAKRVAVGHGADNAARFGLDLPLLGGTAEWRRGQRKGQEREAHCVGAAGMHCILSLYNTKARKHESTKKTNKITEKQADNNGDKNMVDVFPTAGAESVRNVSCFRVFVFSCFRDCCCFCLVTEE